MACRYALVVGSDYRDWLELKSYFARSFITSLVQPFLCPVVSYVRDDRVRCGVFLHQILIMQNGFIKVAAAIPSVKVADCSFNIQQIESLMASAEGQGVEILCLPELAITAYTCQDLFQQQLLLDEAEASLLKLMEFSRNLNVTALVGVPIAYNSMLFNCAAVIQRGKVYGLVPKTYIPNYKEFYEKRWFTSAQVLASGVELRFAVRRYP